MYLVSRRFLRWTGLGKVHLFWHFWANNYFYCGDLNTILFAQTVVRTWTNADILKVSWLCHLKTVFGFGGCIHITLTSRIRVICTGIFAPHIHHELFI